MKKSNLINNFLFQLIYQSTILIVPLIVSPYLTRVLKDTALGVFTYINTIAYYFVILGNLGVNTHGKRLIATNSDDDISLRQSFWSLFYLHVLTSTVALILYVFYISFFAHEYKYIYLIEVLYVISTIFDITWLYYGLEKLSAVASVNVIFKLAELILIFIFIRVPTDLWKYTLISVLSTFVGNLILFLKAFIQVKPIKIKFDDILTHVKPLLVFSVALIASTLYTVFDKTLLGIMIDKEAVAYYEYSNKIIHVPQSLISVIGMVMFPVACKLVSEARIEEQKKYLKFSLLITSFFGFGSVFGLLAVSDIFISLYYGSAFEASINITRVMSPLILIVGIGSVLRTQCLIPNRMDKEFNLCIVYNAIINLIFSILLIPIYGIYGAVIGTFLAEMFGLLYQLYLCRDYLKFKELINIVAPFAFSGLVMYCAVLTVSVYLPKSFFGLILKIVIGLLTYSFALLIILFLRGKDYRRVIFLEFKDFLDLLKN